MRLVTLLAVLFALTITLTVNAQDDSTFFSMTVIDGQKITVNSRKEYIQLNDLVKTVNALKKMKSEKKITKEDYAAKVAILLGNSIKKGTPEQ